MRLVRLNPQARGADSTIPGALDTGSAKVSADVRAALSAWGDGCAVLGGVAVFGCTPPGFVRPLDAVIVLPRGVIVVAGVDLPEPALKLEAPLHTPWNVDGWPLVRAESAVNPGFEAMESAAALARVLQEHGAEPLPVATIVAVGPYVERVTQPTSDLHRGMRVLYPSTTTMLAAVRELATYEQACTVEAARRLLAVLNSNGRTPGVAELSAEGFPDAVTRDLAVAETMHIPKVIDEAPQAPPSSMPRQPTTTSGFRRYAKHFAISAAAIIVLAAISLLVMVNQDQQASSPPLPAIRVDGVDFTQRAAKRDADCARHSYGDVRAWLQQHPCASLNRTVFDAKIAGRQAAVSVAIVESGDENSGRALQDLASGAGTGGVRDLVSAGYQWPGQPVSFDDAALAVERIGGKVRIVQAVWSAGRSAPGDVALRTLTERGMRLPSTP